MTERQVQRSCLINSHNPYEDETSDSISGSSFGNLGACSGRLCAQRKHRRFRRRCQQRWCRRRQQRHLRLQHRRNWRFGLEQWRRQFDYGIRHRHGFNGLRLRHGLRNIGYRKIVGSSRRRGPGESCSPPRFRAAISHGRKALPLSCAPMESSARM